MLSIVCTAIFSFFFWSITIIYGAFCLLLYLVPKPFAHRVVVFWCSLIVFLLRWICGVRYQVVGKENIESVAGPFVILSKHQSTWETFYLQALFFPSATILKQELLRIPFFGWGLRLLRPIPIDRSNPRQALRQVKSGGLARLDQGLNLLLFPEGTRMPYGEKGKYARSGADIARDADASIVPIAVNAGQCWAPRRWVKHPGLITVAIGKPIPPNERDSRDLILEVEQWIETRQVEIEGRAVDSQSIKAGS